jgi:hypothetical protein
MWQRRRDTDYSKEEIRKNPEPRLREMREKKG